VASLKKQAISSVKWTTLHTTVAGITGPLLLIVKARFLSPEEFGYIALILIVIGLFHLLESFGISQAVIQKDEINIQESSTLFYFNILLCGFLAALLFFLSPFIASFFSLPDLKEHLPVVCILVLITGPSLLFRAFLEKRMYFKHLSLVAIARNILILFGTTAFLAVGKGVPGVIHGQILGALFTTISIVILTIWLKTTSVSFYFNPVRLLPFLRFGIFVSAKQLMTFAAHRLDEVVIGYFLTPEILGIYHFGKNLLERVRSLMTMSFGKVIFPVFSKLKHQPQKLAMAYQRISRYIAFAAFPFFSGVAITAHLFVPLIFGEQWVDSVIVFQVFSVAVILMALTANVSSSLLYSVNKPDMVFWIDVATNTAYFITLYLFASHGMIAVLIAYSFYVVYKTLILQWYANRQFTDSFFAYFRELAMPAVSALVMVGGVLLFQFSGSLFMSDFIQLAGSVVTGIVVYGLMVWFFARDTLLQIRSAAIKGDIVVS